MGLKTREYVYTDAKGRPVLRKLRFDPKAFRTQSWSEERGRWVDRLIDEQLHAADRAMYHLPELLWALRADKPVWWTEGEKCADAIRGVGAVGTSHWQGARSATRGQAKWFARGNGPILLVVDADRNGCGASCGLIRKRLLLDAGVARSRIKLRKPPHPHKDAAAAIEAGRSLADFRRPDESAMTRLAAEYEHGARSRLVEHRSSDWMSQTGEWKPERAS